MICPNCRNDNPANAKFCLNCGVPLKHQCANCKTDLPAGARFCMNCGQPVNVVISVVAPTAPSTYSNTATVTPSVTDTQPGNNSVSVTVQVK